ncbi:hypothetical protein [Limnohabitans sp.]|nr:hypothetical protein [Limnohabitans sp.]
MSAEFTVQAWLKSGASSALKTALRLGLDVTVLGVRGVVWAC